jgi:glycosyltransferase involved in cell wall biosynthesis
VIVSSEAVSSEAMSIAAVVIVVPVHDEAELLDRCLTALGAAIAAVGVRCEARIVLDACTDGSAVVAARHPFPVVRIDAGAVGAARVRGIGDALAELAHIPSHRVWIANTDADSAVPANWLRVQLDAAGAGADVVVGTVRPDFDNLSPRHRRLWLDTHARGIPNGHTHGANLGLRASTYHAACGFEPVDEHEDVRLVEACRRLGATVVASDDAEVLTSGRFVGRTPAGYAGYLRDQERMLRAESALHASQREAS